MLGRWAVLALMVLGFGVNDASAQGTDFRVLAGASPAGGQDGTGGAARFNLPTGIAVDSTGALYVADSSNCSIRKITPAGAVTTLTGTANSNGPCGNSNGPSNVAQFSIPSAAAVDSMGTVYIADTFNHTIRKISGGVVSTLAGLAGSPGSADGTGSTARFNAPRGIAVDGAGMLYVVDTNNHTIRTVTPGGLVTTIAGLPGSPGSVDGTGTAARFSFPRGIAVDSTGALYVGDSNNHTIRKITAGAVVTTLAGLAGTSGSTNATGSAARFSNPRGVAVDSAGNVYVADTNNNRIRQVTAAGVVTTLAGSGLLGGFDGTGAGARFNNPEGVAVDSAGVVYVADTTSDTIRKITTPAGVVTTLAGFYGSLGAVDGAGSSARFAYPYGVAVDATGNVYVADRSNQTVRKVTPAGNVTTLAGLADTPGSADGTGSAARFNAPQGAAVDNAGTVYIADTNNHTIRMITPGGAVSTLAGLAGTSGSLDGTGSAARFNLPNRLAVDSAGTVYVADSQNQTIRKIAPGGVVTTLAGLAGTSGSSDGTGSAARFNNPRGIAVDGAGVVYVADTFNSTIRKITPGGVVTTLAGLAGVNGSNDGTGSAARFNGPGGIAVDDAAGIIYVSDSNNQTIRKITAGAVVTTIAGCPGCIGGDGRLFNGPQSIAVNARGDMYVADSRNNTIRTNAPIASSVVVDFGPQYGIWVRRGQEWSQLHPYTAEAMLRIRGGDHDGMLFDFGPGVGVWFWEKDADGEEGWFQVHTQSPSAMVGVDFDGNGEVDSAVFDFPGQGLWLFDGEDEWLQLHPSNASHLAAADLNGDGGDDVIVDFPGYGLWVVYGNGTWAQLHPSDVTSIVVADLDGNRRSDLVVNFPGYGVWAYMNGATWAQIHQLDVTRLAAGDLDGNGMSDLIVDFGATYGVWTRKNGTTWAPLHYLTTEGITTGDLDGNGHDEVIIDFGAPGVWSWEDVGGWHQVHGANPKAITTGRFY